MKKYILFLMLVIIHFNAFTQGDVTTARFMKQPVIVDGRNTEWGELNLYDEYTKLSFAIADDSSNIYLCFESEDELNQMKMMRAGMKITLTEKGKSKHEASILFPIPRNKQAQILDTNGGEKNTTYTHPTHDASFFRKNFIASHSTMMVSGFSTANGEVSINNTRGLKAAINWDSSSHLFYEVAIAKSEFFGSGYSEKNTTDDITLAVVINALPRSAGEGSNKNGGYYTGNENEGEMTSGTHNKEEFNADKRGNEGEVRQPSDAEKASLNTKTSFKQKFALSNDAQ